MNDLPPNELLYFLQENMIAISFLVAFFLWFIKGTIETAFLLVKGLWRAVRFVVTYPSWRRAEQERRKAIWESRPRHKPIREKDQKCT